MRQRYHQTPECPAVPEHTWLLYSPTVQIGVREAATEVGVREAATEVGVRGAGADLWQEAQGEDERESQNKTVDSVSGS